MIVEKEQELGRSGMTGLAGGDHLHFTMLVNGQMVNPVEWWDQHWIQDRILRKLKRGRRRLEVLGSRFTSLQVRFASDISRLNLIANEPYFTAILKLCTESFAAACGAC